MLRFGRNFRFCIFLVRPIISYIGYLTKGGGGIAHFLMYEYTRTRTLPLNTHVRSVNKVVLFSIHDFLSSTLSMAELEPLVKTISPLLATERTFLL